MYKKTKRNEEAPCCAPTKQLCKSEKNDKSAEKCTTRTGKKVCGQLCNDIIGKLEALSEEHKRKAMQMKKRKEGKVPTRTTKPKKEGGKEISPGKK